MKNRYNYNRHLHTVEDYIIMKHPIGILDVDRFEHITEDSKKSLGCSLADASVHRWKNGWGGGVFNSVSIGGALVDMILVRRV